MKNWKLIIAGIVIVLIGLGMEVINVANMFTSQGGSQALGLIGLVVAVIGIFFTLKGAY